MPRPPSSTPDQPGISSCITAGDEDGHPSVVPGAKWFRAMFEQQTADLRSLAAEHHKALCEVLAQVDGSALTCRPSSPSSVVYGLSRSSNNFDEIQDLAAAERVCVRQSTEDEIQKQWDERDRAKKMKRAKRERERERHEIERQKVPEERRGRVNVSSLQQLVQEARYGAGKSACSCECLKVRTAEDFVNGPLDMIMGWVIILNAVVLVIQSEWMGWQAEFSLGLQETESLDWLVGFKVTEHIFMVLYIVELVLRLMVLRGRWLFTHNFGIKYTNLLDAAIIAVSGVDLYIFEHMSDVDSPSLVLARLIRLARVARTLRVIRVMKLFRQLRILTATFVASLGALFWSMVILAIFMFLGALVLCQATHDFVTDKNNDLEERLWVFEMYGSAGKAMYTMFEATNSGGWPNYARPLINHVSPWFILFFLVYVTIVIFGIIRIITAMFIKETLSVASSDATLAVQENLRVKDAYRKKLQVVFEEADSSGDGVISRAELETALENRIVLDYLSVLEIEIHEVEPLFDLLDDGDGAVTIQEFCQGVMRLKGQARALDVVSVMHDANIIMNQGRDIKQVLQRVEATLGIVLSLHSAEAKN
eukprot:TRINITY_DN88346_c0_g1_i1.p1 TRINITY_DN88346_c0_g1~~TRINITY_DN88346_c0_g1_i1.p1  ORF type:complete len:593 (+),score=104.24 TRINITY_DN88346_c0_g1_i1:62-1840(+)